MKLNTAEFYQKCHAPDLSAVQVLRDAGLFKMSFLFKRWFMNKKEREMYAHVIDNGLINACSSGNLSLVQFLLTSPQLRYIGVADIRMNNNYALRCACKWDRVDIVKYLLTAPELTRHADIVPPASIETDYKFDAAFSGGSIELIDFLLHELAQQNYEKMDEAYEMAVKIACSMDRIDVIHFLAQNKAWSPIMLHKGFFAACRSERFTMVKELIMNFNVPYSAAVKGFLKEYAPAQKITSMFELRDLHNRLQNDLLNKPVIKTNNKI